MLSANDHITIQLIIAIVLILIIITIFLFIFSILVRFRSERKKQGALQIREMFQPLVIEYMITGDESVLTKIQNRLRAEKYILPLVDIVVELLKDVQGSEATLLRDILSLPEVKGHFLKWIKSESVIQTKDACLYFSNVGVTTDKEFRALQPLIGHENLIVAHSAASAMMSSEKVSIRLYALRQMAMRRRVSGLALVEMMYLFHNDEIDQMDEEARLLSILIRDKEVNERSLAMIIRAISDIGYVTIADDLYELLQSGYWHNSTSVTEALILSIGVLNLMYATDFLIDTYLKDPRPRIRAATVDALSKFSDTELTGVFREMTDDPEFAVRIKSIYALAHLGDEGKQELESMDDITQELRQMIVNITAEVRGEQ